MVKCTWWPQQARSHFLAKYSITHKSNPPALTPLSADMLVQSCRRLIITWLSRCFLFNTRPRAGCFTPSIRLCLHSPCVLQDAFLPHVCRRSQHHQSKTCLKISTLQDILLSPSHLIVCRHNGNIMFNYHVVEYRTNTHRKPLRLRGLALPSNNAKI